MSAPSFEDLRAIGAAEAAARRPKANLSAGTRYDAVLCGAAGIGDLIVGFGADRFKATYVDGARGGDLTLLADDHYGLTRFPAVSSVGAVTFTRTAPGAGTYTIPTTTHLATTRDAAGREVRFVTDAPAVWGAGIGGTVTVAAHAETGGVAGNVGIGTITRILDPQTEGFTVANALLFAGGVEAETDDALRERIRGFSQTIRRGTIAALEYGAKTVAGVIVAKALEDTTGRVTVYVADLAGNSNPTMVSNVTTEIENWRAAGALVVIAGGTPLLIDSQITLTLKSGANPAVISTAISSAIVARLALLTSGETVYRTALAQTIRNVSPDIVECRVQLRTGANPFADIDIQPPANNVPRSGAVTVA